MADLIKLFDFKASNELKSDFKMTGFDRPVMKEKEKEVGQKDSGNSFSKALESVSNAVQNKESVKENSDNKTVQNPEKKEKTEKQAEKILAPISQMLKQLKENPQNKQAIEKFEKILSKPVSLDELAKNLNQLIQLLMNINQQTQKVAVVKPEQLQADLNSIKGLKNGLNQLKELMKDDMGLSRQLMASLQSSGLLIASADNVKEKKIYDIKVEKGAQKNSDKSKNIHAKDSQNQESVLKMPGESLKAKEVKEKIEASQTGKDVKEKVQPKKESGEKFVKNNDKEQNSIKKEGEIMPQFMQKLEQADKMSKPENARNLDKAQRAEIGKQIIDQIGEKVTGTIGKNYSQITMQLKPEELGNVKIVLEMKNDTIKGRIIVDNNEVKDIVQDNINQIKSILQDSGVKLGELEVSTNSQGQSFEQASKEDLFQKMVMQNQKVFSVLSQLQTYEKGFENSYPVENNRIYLKA